jgi:2'-5' RNA ligase
MTRQRLFAAVWPSDEVNERLQALPRPDDAPVRWTHASQWHVTLRFFGWVDEDQRRALDEAWAAIELEAVDRPVIATAGPAVGRFGQRVLHVPVRGLEQLATAVITATAAVGESPDPRPFRGHITLARSAGRSADLRSLVGGPISAQWRVEEITLVRSVPERGGSRYEVAARRPLGT